MGVKFASMEWQIGITELDNFAKSFWDYVNDATVFAFHGQMGAGKTTTITALCRYKGVKDHQGSPTFSIINEYSFSDNGRERKIYHIDLYRLKDMEEIIQSGVEDAVYSGEICMVEWPEKAPELFDDTAMHVQIGVVDHHTRSVKVLTHAQFLAASVVEQS
jgi:tRNA threonylcarbamoyladenosine biosynthesis protein TsaE